MKILAVEDNPADVEILRELLDPLGSSFELQNVKNLAAAGAALSKGETEFILLDLGLPDSQGIATLREVRARFPSLPIVVLTGFDDEETGMLALHEGAQDYLVKGRITGPSLMRSIRYAHERNRIEEELVRKNRALDAMNEELTTTDEELRQAHAGLEQHVQERTQELKKAVDALKTERQRLYEVLETLPVYVCLLAPDYHMPFANRYFRETFGEPKGRCCYDFLFNLQEPCQTCETYTVMKTRAPHHWYWTGPNDRDYDIYDFPFIDTNGSFLILEMGIDITDRKRAETELQKAHDLLEIRVRERTEELRQKNERLNVAYEDLSAIHEELRQANDELLNNNLQLTALNQELTAAQEELHQNVEELGKSEQDLKRSEANLKEALAEKEILLSEIHHRVKNNLAAFISLLSLEGSSEDTPAGRMLRQDLQNRARSMALIHETLYRTNTFDKVNMEMYLTTLLDQIAKSFKTKRFVKTSVDAQGIMLDIQRATPAGLIINELVTNSFKYAFPESFDSVAVRNAPPAISIALARNDEAYVMTVKDNGVGLPPEIDLAKTQTLGLKLVNFLAKHQMHAKIEVNTENGTEFVFRLKE